MVGRSEDASPSHYLAGKEEAFLKAKLMRGLVQASDGGRCRREAQDREASRRCSSAPQRRSLVGLSEGVKMTTSLMASQHRTNFIKLFPFLPMGYIKPKHEAVNILISTSPLICKRKKCDSYLFLHK